MYSTSPPQQQEKKQGKKCNDADSMTKKTIKTSKNTYCSTLKDKFGVLRQAQEAYRGKRIEYEHKKCRFISTEKNYRIFRNLELSVGIQLRQCEADIETNIKNYVGFDTKLSKALTDLLATIKTTKVKFSDLRDSACKLDACCKDSCNRTQWAILTGEKFEDCGDDKSKHGSEQEPPHGNRPQDCKDVITIIHELIHEPSSFSKEIDVILNSGADVVGIQTFCNISSLSTQFLPVFKTNATALDDFIIDRMTAGKSTLDDVQKDLTQVIKDITDNEIAKYNARIDVDAIKGVKDFLCDPKCECVCEGEGKLEKCKCDICAICKEVAEIYTIESEEKQPPVVAQ